MSGKEIPMAARVIEEFYNAISGHWDFLSRQYALDSKEYAAPLRAAFCRGLSDVGKVRQSMIGSRLNLIVREGASIQFLDAPEGHIWGLREKSASIIACQMTIWFLSHASLSPHFLLVVRWFAAMTRKRRG